MGQEDSAKSWALIRLAKGVRPSGQLCGIDPARVGDGLIKLSWMQEASVQSNPARLFRLGKHVLLTEAPFTSIEGIYQMADGERRIMMLIEFLNKPAAV